MSTSPELNDEDLRSLLRAARPAPDLPPRFQNSVWRRIERAEATRADGAVKPWLDALLARLLQPRFALAGAAAVVLLGGLTGLANSSATARQLAQERYLSAVAPHSLH